MCFIHLTIDQMRKNIGVTKVKIMHAYLAAQEFFVFVFDRVAAPELNVFK